MPTKIGLFHFQRIPTKMTATTAANNEGTSTPTTNTTSSDPEGEELVTRNQNIFMAVTHYLLAIAMGHNSLVMVPVPASFTAVTWKL